MNENINYDVVTLDDCIELYEKKNLITNIENGCVVNFEKQH